MQVAVAASICIWRPRRDARWRRAAEVGADDHWHQNEELVMQAIQQLATVAALSLGLTACAGDSRSINEEALDSVLPASDTEGWAESPMPTPEAPRSVPAVAGNLSAESRCI